MVLLVTCADVTQYVTTITAIVLAARDPIATTDVVLVGPTCILRLIG
jgi:hypothetical protein